MRKTLATIGLVTALAAIAPLDAEAGGSAREPQWRGHSGPSHHPYPYARPHFYRPYYYRPYYYSWFYYAPPAYAVTPGSGYYYSVPRGSYSAPAAPQLQTEVVFPEGRYVLQGDGDAVPYRWVWVPNPPTAPPADAQGPR